MNAFILRWIEADLYHNLIEFIFEVGFFDGSASRRDKRVGREKKAMRDEPFS